MREIKKRASAGTIESSDAYVEIDAAGEGIELSLSSVVQKQFGEAIRGLALAVLAEAGIANARVNIIDRGALDCVLRARLETAIERACEEG